MAASARAFLLFLSSSFLASFSCDKRFFSRVFSRFAAVICLCLASSFSYSRPFLRHFSASSFSKIFSLSARNIASSLAVLTSGATHSSPFASHAAFCLSSMTLCLRSIFFSTDRNTSKPASTIPVMASSPTKAKVMAFFTDSDCSNAMVTPSTVSGSI